MAGTKMQLEDWLDDLCVRFIINLPQEDLSSVERIIFHVEEAQWFYEDFIRPLDPALPQMTLRQFTLRIFQHCPLFASYPVQTHMTAFDDFLKYKTTIPVRGAILLNESMDSALLVKGWKKGSSWSFPRGKINKDEDNLDCAIREVNEETGFDIKAAGLVPKPEDIKFIEVTVGEQQIRLYVFRDIPTDTAFAPKTRKEISQIQWFKLSELPTFKKKGANHDDDAAAAVSKNKFYMVAQFLGPLKKWVAQQRKRDIAKAANRLHLTAQLLPEEPLTEDETAAQTDTGDGPATSAPAIEETVKEANMELKRLIQMQPGPQGLQPTVPEPGVTPRDKGEALMAMLQRKNPVGSQQQQPFRQQQQHSVPLATNVQPHTPFDHIQDQPPQPRSPRPQHLGQRLPENYYQQPPPNFPIAQQTNQNLHYGYQNPPAAPSHAHPNYFNHNQAYIQTQSNQQHRMYPQNQAYQPERGYPQQNVPLMQHLQQARREPVLLHPQPLPPQVQQSVLTRGIVPTPQLQEMAGIPAGGSHVAAEPSGKQPSHYNQGRQPVQQRPLNMIPPQMNEHTLSLLNTLKSATARSSQEPVMNSNHHGPRPDAGNAAPQGTYQPVPAAHMPQGSIQRQQSQPHNLPSIPAIANLYQQVDGTARPALHNNAPAAHATQPLPAENAHARTLLNIFKQGPLSPGSSSDATVRAGKPEHAHSVPGPSVPNGASQQQQHADAMPSTLRSNGAPVAANVEASLPFRPMQILSKPQQSENAPVVPQYSPSTQAPPPPAHRDGRRAMPPLAAHVNQTAPELQAFETRVAPPSKENAAPFAGMLSNQHGSIPEQRQQQQQKLLSLFGKAPQAGAAPAVPHVDKGKQKEVLPEQQQQLLAQLLSPKPGQAQPSTSRRGSGEATLPKAQEQYLLDFLRKM